MKRLLLLVGLVLVANGCSQPAEPVVTTAAPRGGATVTPASTEPSTRVSSDDGVVWPPRLIWPSLIFDEGAGALVLFGGITRPNRSTPQSQPSPTSAARPTASLCTADASKPSTP